MKNPFQPSPTAASGGSDSAASPSVGFLPSDTKKPPQPVAMSATMADKAPAVDLPEKKGFFSRIFGRSKNEETSKKRNLLLEESKTKVKEPSKDEVVAKRHEDLLNSVNDICRSLETSRAQKVEVSVKDLVPPLPVENIDALTKTQEAVSGVLEKVAGRLDRAGKRDDLVVDSLKKVDVSLASLSKVGERSIFSMDGVKGTLGEVNDTMEGMQAELKRAGSRYEELCEKVQNNEREHAETMQKMQQRTLIVNALLGVSLIGCVVAVIIAVAS